MKQNIFWMLLSSLLLTSGMVYAENLTSPVERWMDFRLTNNRFEAPQTEAGVVLYRRAQDLNGPSVNVYVGGEYLASLLPDGFRYTSTCSGLQKFGAEFSGVARSSSYNRKTQLGEVYDLPAAAISYFKIVSGAAGQPRVVSVRTEDAMADLSSLKEQAHTLSRVSATNNCEAHSIKPIM